MRVGGRPNSAGAGFDPSRNLLVLPTSDETDLFLVAGEELNPVLSGSDASFIERAVSKDEKISAELTGWERTQNIRAFRFKGANPGEGVFNCYLGSSPWVVPLTVRVTTDRDHRQAGDGPKGEMIISGALRLELAGLTFRDALVGLRYARRR